MNECLNVSLIIPTHNRGKLIVETIEAALRQTVPFAEIIIVDDASTDDTLVRLHQFGDRVTVIPSSKIGVQAARNLGVRAAGTEYITLCDSDDLLHFTFLETISSWLAAHPECDSVYSNYRSFSGKQIEQDILSGAPAGFFKGARFSGQFIEHIPDLYARTMNFQPLMPTGATVRKSFYESIGGFDPAFDGFPAEDWEYTLRAVSAGNTAICVTPLVQIRRHSGNDSSNLLRQVLGEVEILNYALRHHAAAQRYTEIITNSIRQRRHWIFYESFRKRQFSVAALVFPALEGKPDTLRFKIKSLVMSAYLRFRKCDTQTVFGFKGLADTPEPWRAPAEQHSG